MCMGKDMNPWFVRVIEHDLLCAQIISETMDDLRPLSHFATFPGGGGFFKGAPSAAAA